MESPELEVISKFLSRETLLKHLFSGTTIGEASGYKMTQDSSFVWMNLRSLKVSARGVFSS